jgi:hypothetical protein
MEKLAFFQVLFHGLPLGPEEKTNSYAPPTKSPLLAATEKMVCHRG